MVITSGSSEELKADLDGATFAYGCRMQFLERALLDSCKKSHTTLVIQHCLYLRLSYDIFCDVHNSSKRVVGSIYTKQFVSSACCKFVACNKVVP